MTKKHQQRRWLILGLVAWIAGWASNDVVAWLTAPPPPIVIPATTTHAEVELLGSDAMAIHQTYLQELAAVGWDLAGSGKTLPIAKHDGTCRTLNIQARLMIPGDRVPRIRLVIDPQSC